MKILVLNAGSSSIKYRLFDLPAGRLLARGVVERIGDRDARGAQQAERGRIETDEPVPGPHEGFELVMRMLTDPHKGAVESVKEIGACGHRVVHGGGHFAGAVRIDAALEAIVEENIELAPLHNPANLVGIREARRFMPDVPHVACFDTAFHHSMPETAYRYGLSYELCRKHRIRRYGFHGTSHKFVAQRAAELLGRPSGEVNLITCHLGNGSTVTAVRNGASVDTSSGFTPLEGLIMGSRAGSFDPAILLYLARKGYTTDELDSLANTQSGLLGISGISNDVRRLEEEAAAGNARAILALDLFAYAVRKTIGSYLAVLNGCDAIVFTGGIGERGPDMRRRILSDLDALGIRLDDRRNDALVGEEGEISAAASEIRVLVVPTDEELVIARETFDFVCGDEAAGKGDQHVGHI